VQELTPQAGHQLFISPLKELAVGYLHWAENGGSGRYQVITGRSTPSVRCLGVGHVSFLNLACQFLTATCGTPDALQVYTGLMRREFRKPAGCRVTGRSAPVASGAHRTKAQKGLQNLLTPDAHHRTHSESARCSTLAGSSTPNSEASVRCLCTQHPVSVSQGGNTLTTSPNFPSAQ